MGKLASRAQGDKCLCTCNYSSLHWWSSKRYGARRDSLWNWRSSVGSSDRLSVCLSVRLSPTEAQDTAEQSSCRCLYCCRPRHVSLITFFLTLRLPLSSDRPPASVSCSLTDLIRRCLDAVVCDLFLRSHTQTVSCIWVALTHALCTALVLRFVFVPFWLVCQKYTVSQKKACDYIFCNNWNNECPII